MEERLLHPREAADMLRVSTKTLVNWEEAGKLTAVRATSTSKRRYKLSDVQKLIEEGSLMNYAKEAARLRDERVQAEEIEHQNKMNQDLLIAEEQRKMNEEEQIRNKEIIALLQQFDRFEISNGEEKLEASLASTQNGSQIPSLKMGSSSISRMRSWQELGAVLITARYYGGDNKYVVRRYDRYDQSSSYEIGKYNDVESMMESVTKEVAKL